MHGEALEYVGKESESIVKASEKHRTGIGNASERRRKNIGKHRKGIGNASGFGVGKASGKTYQSKRI